MKQDSATPTILVNHLGFKPDEAKHAVFINPQAETFSVVSRWSKETVLAKPLVRGGMDLGDAWIGSFSEVHENATYLIRCGDAVSRVVMIWDKLYDYPRRVLLNYFASQRCGDSASGWNAPCHIRDARRVDTGEHVDVSGGWHQSGDLRKWTTGTIYGVIGLCRFLLHGGARWDEGRAAEEIRWGNRYFHRMVRPDGGLMDHVILPLGWDEERDLYANDAPAMAMLHFVAAQAMASQVFHDSDSYYADQCLTLARRVWDYINQNEAPQRPYVPPVIPKHHDWLPLFHRQNYAGSAIHLLDRIFAAMAMYSATHSQRWIDYAAQDADALVELQVGGNVIEDPFAACLREAPGSETLACTTYDSFLGKIALCELTEMLAGHPHAERWAGLITDMATQHCRMSERNAWGLIPSYWYAGDPGDGRSLRALKGGCYAYFFRVGPLIGGVNADALAHALFLRKAAAWADTEACLNTAARQLDWVLGCNPFDASTVEGVGLNQPERFINPREFFPPTPQIPGAVMTGVCGELDDSPSFTGTAAEYDMPPTALLLWLLSELAQ